MSNPTNHALTATVTASSTEAGYPATRLKDNVLVYGLGTSWFSATGVVTNVTVDFDFGSAKPLDTVEPVNGGANRGCNAYEIYVSDDGIAWGAAIKSGNLANNTTLQKVALGASYSKRYVRFKILTNHGDANFISMSEIRIYTDATDNFSAAVYIKSFGITGVVGNLRDNDPSTYGWVAGGVQGAMFQFDLGAAYWIDSLWVVWYGGVDYTPKTLYVWTSSDGVAWTLVEQVAVASVSTSQTVAEFAVAKKFNSRYLGLSSTLSWSASGQPYTNMCELRLYAASTPTAWAGISSLVAETLKVKASWTAYEAAACKAYRVYIRSGSAPDAFGTSSAYFLCELENDITSISIGTLADKTTALVPGTQYYVIVRPVFNDDTESSDTTCLNQTPDAAAGGGGAWVF